MRYLHDQSIFRDIRGKLPRHSLSATLVCLLLLLSTGCGRLLRPFHHNPPPPPNHPPTVTVTPNPTKVFAGSNDSIVLQAQAADPDNDPLSYKWMATGGFVEGTGAETRWNSAGVAPGKYTITTAVDDGRGGTANTTTEVTVEQKPNTPPVVSSCVANPSTITVGQQSTVTTTATDADNDQVTYTYTTSGGKVTGSGASVQFDSTGTVPGTYTIACSASDGRSQASGSTIISVQAPAQQAQLELRLSLPSIYFPAGQPTQANPNGGLLPSQQNTLAALAQDFKKYLQFKPDAHLILQGHADPRGSAEYNKTLSERRVTRTKAFITSLGVDRDHIDTQGLGTEQPMSTEQVTQIIEWQNLTPVQKNAFKNHSHELALALTNRVDVIISTTGQTSSRQFPFNTPDALRLLSPPETAAAAVIPTPLPSPTPTPGLNTTCQGLVLFVAPHTIDLAPVHRESAEFAAIVGRSPTDLATAANQLHICDSIPACERELGESCITPTMITKGGKDIHVWHIPEIDQCPKIKATLSGLGLDSIPNQNGGSDEKDVCPGSGKWNWVAQPKGDNHRITFWIGGKAASSSDFHDLLPEIAAYELGARNSKVNWFVSLVNEILELSLVKQVVLGTIGLGLFGWLGVGVKNVYRRLFHIEQPAPPVQQPAQQSPQTPPVIVVVPKQEPEQPRSIRDRLRRRPTHRRNN